MERLEGVTVHFTGKEGKGTPKTLLRGCVPVSMFNKQTPGLLDSGASVCVIKLSFLLSLKLPVYCKMIPRKTSMYLANGSIITSKHRVVIPFKIYDKLHRMEFKVLENASNNVILGVDFLEKYRASFDYFPSNEEVSPIRAISSLTIPSMTEVTLTAKIVSGALYDPDADVGVCENLDRGENRVVPFLVKKALVTPNEYKRVTISLLNCSNHYRTIKRGQILALYVPQKREQLYALNTLLPSPIDGSSNTRCITSVQEPTEAATWQAHQNKPTCKPAYTADHLQITASGNVMRQQGAGSAEPQTCTPKTSMMHRVEVSGDDIVPAPPNCVLNQIEREELHRLLDHYNDVFVGPDGQLGLTHLINHRIEIMPEAVPVSHMPYRASPLKREAMKNAIAKQLDQGVIEKTNTGEWSSPAFLVKKSDGSWRLVVDYRHINLVTRPQYTNIPRIDDTLDSLGEAKPKIFSVLDLESGFYQVPIDERDRDATAFMTTEGRFRYKVLSMGQKNSPRCFQALMDLVLNKVAFKSTIAYMDDIIVYSGDAHAHMSDLAEVFELLRAANLKLKRSKCTFGVNKIKYLGFIISDKGISPCMDKVAAIKTFPVPKNVKDVRSFCGLAQFYRKFIENFAGIARPMYDLLKDKAKFEWSPECEEAFQKLKEALTGDSILQYPDFSKKFVLATDASDISIGGSLQQEDAQGNLKPVAYAGRSLKPAEKNYTVTHRELLAVVWAVEYFRVYLESAKFLILTDHSALTFLMKQKHANQRLIRWQIVLNGFDFDIQHIKGKLNVVPDALSRREYDYDETEADKRFSNTSELASLKVEDQECLQSIRKCPDIKPGLLIDKPSCVFPPGTLRTSDGKFILPTPPTDLSPAHEVHSAKIHKSSIAALTRAKAREDGTARGHQNEGPINGPHRPPAALVTQARGQPEVHSSCPSVTTDHVPSPKDGGGKAPPPASVTTPRAQPKVDTTLAQHHTPSDTFQKPDTHSPPIPIIPITQPGLTADAAKPLHANQNKSQTASDARTHSTPSQPLIKDTDRLGAKDINLGEGTTAEAESTNKNPNGDSYDNEFPRDNSGQQAPPHTGKLTLKQKRQKRLFQARANVRNQMDLLKKEVSIDLSQKSLAKGQKDDVECKMLRDFLTSRTLPTENYLKRWILLNQDRFMINDDILYEISEKSRTGEMIIRLVLPEIMQVAAIQLFHDTSLSAHKGLANTLDDVKQRFWWYGMSGDVQKYVASCHKCTSTRLGGKTIKPPMTLRDPAPYPFCSICIDTLQLIETPRGYKYVHVVVDYHTRFVVAFPAKTNNTFELAQGFNDFYLSRFGAPRMLQSDNGSTFTSDLFKNLCVIWGINQKFSSAFMPRTQGLVERANKTILTRLRTLISKTQTEWDMYLQNVTFAMNSAPAFATGHSAFLLAMGWMPSHPYDVRRPLPAKAPTCVRDQFLKRIEVQTKAIDMSVKHTLATREKMKKHYDKSSHMVYFYEGDIVFLHVPRIILKDTKRKLTPLYHGPFTVVKLTTPYTAILRRHYDQKTLKKSVHISRLKKGEVRNLADFHKHVVYRESDLPCTLTMCTKTTPIVCPKDKRSLGSKIQRVSKKVGRKGRKVLSKK